jgi:hypothetical protein
MRTGRKHADGIVVREAAFAGPCCCVFHGSHNRRRMSSVAVQALDQLCAGVIIADNDGRVVEMNRAAEATVQLGDGLNICNGRLCARRAFETIKIAEADCRRYCGQ